MYLERNSKQYSFVNSTLSLCLYCKHNGQKWSDLGHDHQPERGILTTYILVSFERCEIESQKLTVVDASSFKIIFRRLGSVNSCKIQMMCQLYPAPIFWKMFLKRGQSVHFSISFVKYILNIFKRETHLHILVSSALHFKKAKITYRWRNFYSAAFIFCIQIYFRNKMRWTFNFIFYGYIETF